ncbi:MAG: hypothetical protein ACI4L7_00095 [Christensenellales bacterium]
MNILFYILCATFLLSLFILKFKWFKKIGEWLAKPFIIIMKKNREKKKKKELGNVEKGDRLGKSELQIRPVVLPPQLNPPQKENKQEVKPTQQKEAQPNSVPLTRKEAFGNNPFVPMPSGTTDLKKENSSFGTKFVQKTADNSSNGQDRIKIEIPNNAQNSSNRQGFFASQNRRPQSSGKEKYSSTFSINDLELNDDFTKQNTISNGFFEKGSNGTKSISHNRDMDAIMAKRQKEFETYKRQKDSLNIDNKEIDVSNLPPKLKRLLVMGILDKKDYD